MNSEIPPTPSNEDLINNIKKLEKRIEQLEKKTQWQNLSWFGVISAGLIGWYWEDIVNFVKNLVS